MLSLTVPLADSESLVTVPPSLDEVQEELHPLTPPSLVVRLATPMPLWRGQRPFMHPSFSEVDGRVGGAYLVRRSKHDHVEPQPYSRYLVFERFPRPEQLD